MSKPPFPWLTDDAYKTAPLRERALLWAAYEADVTKTQEHPKGSNRGPRVDEYEATYGIQGQPWCACFLGWCFTQAGGKKGPDFPNSPLVADWQKWGKVRNRLVKGPPKRGDVCGVVHPNGTGHIWIMSDETHSIEGNTNDDGEREGYEVCRRVRTSQTFILRI